MPGRGPQTFKKRQKEQERRERQQEKMAKRLQRKTETDSPTDEQDLLDPDAAIETYVSQADLDRALEKAGINLGVSEESPDA